MAKIAKVWAREVLDSKGDPTVEVELTLESGEMAVDSAPSGASTGEAEALELRDSDSNRYSGKGEQQAIKNVNEKIAAEIVGKEFGSVKELDECLLRLDGTPNKSSLGANAILPVSEAFTRVMAMNQHLKLYEYIGKIAGASEFKLPRPLVLVMEGGKHGAWSTDIQEYMILPTIKWEFREAIEHADKIFSMLGKILEEKGYATGVGLEGAYCPQEIESNSEALELIVMAIERAGLKPGEDFGIAIDAAASEFFDQGMYILKSEGNKVYEPDAWIEKLVEWTQRFPIVSIEDPFDQEQWSDWAKLTERIGKSIQIVGDDLIVTKTSRIQKAIDNRAINSALIKLNQVGTVSETMEAIKAAQAAGFMTIQSHRSGETNDDFSADMAVGSGCPECKFGGLDRGERVAKYNQLLRIAEHVKG